MTPREAEQTLSAIRTLMERGTVYKHISSASAIGAGCVTLVGCAVRGLGLLPIEERWSFFTTWAGVFALSLLVIVYFTASQAKRSGEVVLSRSARSVLLSILPAFFAAVVLSHVLFQSGYYAIMPGTWMLLYGCGALAMSFFTPLSIRALGIAFLAAGAVALVFFPGHDVIAMGLSFGGIHLAWGIGLSLQRYLVPVQPAADGVMVREP